MRLITLPSGKRITLRTYLDSWRKLKQLPPETEVANWAWYPVKAGRILQEIRDGIQQRINDAIPYIDRK